MSAFTTLTSGHEPSAGKMYFSKILLDPVGHAARSLSGANLRGVVCRDTPMVGGAIRRVADS